MQLHQSKVPAVCAMHVCGEVRAIFLRFARQDCPIRRLQPIHRQANLLEVIVLNKLWVELVDICQINNDIQNV